jgi:hypothetical protein
MKILKIPTWWTPAEADCIYRLLDELHTEVWQAYGKEIQEMYLKQHQEQMQNEQNDEFNDEIPF